MPTDHKNAKYVLLGLSSGQQLSVSAVMLYPEAAFQQVLLLKTKAQEELGGFFTGLGFWGSPAWVIGGAALLGSMESLISNAKAKKGIELLKEAALKLEQLKSEGAYFAISEIAGIERSIPSAWRAEKMSNVQLNLNFMGLMDRGRAIQQYAIKREQISAGIANVNALTAFIHNEDEFIWVEAENSHIAVRWGNVESYQFIAP